MDFPNITLKVCQQDFCFSRFSQILLSFRLISKMVGAGKLRSCPPLASAETLFRLIEILYDSPILGWMIQSHTFPINNLNKFALSGSPSNGNLDPPPAMLSLQQFQRSSSCFFFNSLSSHFHIIAFIICYIMTQARVSIIFLIFWPLLLSALVQITSTNAWPWGQVCKVGIWVFFHYFQNFVISPTPGLTLMQSTRRSVDFFRLCLESLLTSLSLSRQ